MDRNMKKYLRQVRCCLPGNKEQKKRILDQVQAQIKDCPPDMTYPELVAFIGEPEAVAAAQIESLPALQVAQDIRRDFWIKRIIVAFLAVVIVILAVALTVAVVDAHKSAYAAVVEGDITIESISVEEKKTNVP